MANCGQSLDAEIFSIADLRAKASAKLPRAHREFFNEGAMDLISPNNALTASKTTKPPTAEDNLDWATAISWIRSVTSLDIWLKGVYAPEAVTLAIQHGINGILISNHGERQLDGVPATLDALRECAPIAKGKITIAVMGASVAAPISSRRWPWGLTFALRGGCQSGD
ncbi:FMN-dependent dehydrogenase-domain-containing protein [Aspergillus multicolor]|uniref:FMN-dependent dehydrogenase-domain-containing protein n=1 Tax=Aspergillus multicolor TaxID=41759 RepID=UPI003CCE34EC